MAEHNSPIEVGPVHPGFFFTKYAPVVGDIGKNPSGWGYGGANLYPAPFRSFYQQQVNANWYLGPYCRTKDGTSGRLKISISDYIGNIGFVQQCWVDFPRGAFDTDSNGDVYPTNAEWWNTTKKHWITVYNLMGGSTLIDVQVAYAVKEENAPDQFTTLGGQGYTHWPTFRNYFNAAINLIGGQTNPQILFGGFQGTCGVASGSGTQSGTPQANPKSGGWLNNISMIHSGAIGAMNWVLANDSEAHTLLGAMFNAMTATQQANAGDTFSDGNRSNNFATALGTHLDLVKDWLEKMDAWADSQLAESKATREANLDRTLEITQAIWSAADLMINGWFLPNLRQAYGNFGLGNAPGVEGTASDPYKWRPLDNVQQNFASYLEAHPTTGAPMGSDFKSYIPSSTPNKSGESEPDWTWFLTLLNRGDVTTVPYVDTTTNEFVFAEDYGFSKGGSVQQADDFLNKVAAYTDQQTANSLGALIDMSPASPFFVLTVVPILVLENAGKVIRVSKGGVPGVTNLDAYETTKFETRISAKNMKLGNPAMYNYMLNTGDANGNKFTAVP